MSISFTSQSTDLLQRVLHRGLGSRWPMLVDLSGGRRCYRRVRHGLETFPEHREARPSLSKLEATERGEGEFFPLPSPICLSSPRPRLLMTVMSSEGVCCRPCAVSTTAAMRGGGGRDDRAVVSCESGLLKLPRRSTCRLRKGMLDQPAVYGGTVVLIKKCARSQGTRHEALPATSSFPAFRFRKITRCRAIHIKSPPLDLHWSTRQIISNRTLERFSILRKVSKWHSQYSWSEARTARAVTGDFPQSREWKKPTS